ncbi:hypothetical protein [Cupriavidus pauculus]|uniref:hypothetical protein n=1 Tax=Cupriavidus pauculus TaxID=82633 RepID=UPI001EE1E4EA|nr:hypothetical protein [Cupriavidus pauculus]GJG96823.1 hypothetical protein CBA19C6_20060 [Cupriavidus pauculus]
MLLRFAYATGLRISVQAQVTIGDLRQQGLPPDQRGIWTLSFVGKSTRVREVIVPVIEELRDYPAVRGLGRAFEHLHRETPLIGHVKTDGRLASCRWRNSTRSGRGSLPRRLTCWPRRMRPGAETHNAIRF